MGSGKTKPIGKRKPAPATAPEVEDVKGLQWLRALAATDYACDQSNISIEELQKRPRFSGIALSTFYRWSVEDRWSEKRRLFIEAWQKAIERRIGDRLVQTRIKEMERLQTIYDKGMTFLEENMNAANSWEGVAAVLLRMAETIDKFRENISSHVIPQAAEVEGTVITMPGSSVPAIRPKLSEDEARIAAKMIIERRREQIRADIAQQEKDKEEKKAALAAKNLDAPKKAKAE